MNLTPIKVRGRRRRGDKDTKNHRQKRIKNGLLSPPRTASRSSSSSKRIRFVKSTEPRELSTIETSKPSGNHYRKPKGPSSFECLPIELVEKIFLYSLNINLPRASPYLAASLSSEHIYRLLILLAFWDNDKVYDSRYNSYNPFEGDGLYGGSPARFEDIGTYPSRGSRIFDIPRILRPLGNEYACFTSQDRRVLQATVLRCRWCTRDRIRRQLPDLTRLAIARWCVNSGYMFREKEKGLELEALLNSDPEEQKEVFSAVVVRKEKKRPEREDQGGQEDEERTEQDPRPSCVLNVKVGEFVALDFKSYTTSSPLDSLWFAPLYVKEMLWFPVLSLRELPPFLFGADADAQSKGLTRSSFSDAHLSLLNTLRYSGQLMLQMPCGSYPSSIANSRDALQQGIHDAVFMNNPRALDVLLKFDHFLYRDLHPYYISSDHFRTAARMYLDIRTNKHKHSNNYEDGTSNRKAQDDALLCFCLLLSSSAESIPYDDPVVTEFAMDVGGVFGKWLLDFMMALPQHLQKVTKNDWGNVVFILRKGNDLCSMGRRYLSEVIPSEELFRIPSRWLDDDVYRYDIDRSVHHF